MMLPNFLRIEEHCQDILELRFANLNTTTRHRSSLSDLIEVTIPSIPYALYSTAANFHFATINRRYIYH